MLLPISCFSCGMPLQQHEKKYYEVLDAHKLEYNEFFSDDSTQEAINKLKMSNEFKTSGYTSFENFVIKNYLNSSNNKLKKIAEKYKYTPEFMALKEIGINERRYCCRRMFLCHPRELASIIL